MSENTLLIISGKAIAPGERCRINIPVAKLYDYTEVSIPVEVIRGRKPGPVLFISAAIHGDEINGTEVIKRLREKSRLLNSIVGTLILVPIVNVFGYNRNVRYLPDRRDLNRCFPGSEDGSLAAQFAYQFMEEIVNKCSHGIDLHTGAIHRTNLPQIRANLDDPATEVLARAFGTPVLLNADLKDGSLRQAVAERQIPILLFEGGEALRYEEKVIRSALAGIQNVMAHLGMIKTRSRSANAAARQSVYIARSSYWLRAPHSGGFRATKAIGMRVDAREKVGVISDPFGDHAVPVTAPQAGIVIGMNLIPTVTNGDALLHIACFKDVDTVEEELSAYDEFLT